MKHGLMHAFGFVIATLLALGAGSATADSVAPYYANPSWDQQLPASTRFIVLSNWGSAAVLDRETGLVWEQSPSATRQPWASAQSICNRKAVGNRLGWRLPTLQELASLIDPSLAVSPPLPTSPIPLPIGNPFANIQKFFYWSATTNEQSPTSAWVVGLDDGTPTSAVKTGTGNIWCVRSGSGLDTQ
jgi:hypothetical protein